MTKLSVNVNKIATLRNARGGNMPNLIQMVDDIIQYGADGITVHPRPDERHIRRQDVCDIAKHISVEFNVEGYPDDNYLQLVEIAKPQQCTLVPDPPHVLTSNAGWDVVKNEALLTTVLMRLKNDGIRTSIFMDPKDLDDAQLAALSRIKPDRVELYTEAYAQDFGTPNAHQTLTSYVQAAEKIQSLRIDINAGHDLNLMNLQSFVKAIPQLKEVSIGHALICDALYYGMSETIKRYLACLS